MTKCLTNELLRHCIKVAPLVLIIIFVGLYGAFTEDPANVHSNRALLAKREADLPLGEDIETEVQCKIPRNGTCEYIKAYCSDSDGYIPYLQLYYCSGQGLEWLIWIFFIVWIVVIFYILGSTAEEFFCTALMKISKNLHLSPNVAGVTFLALGNGSPDIFASFVGINNGLFPQAVGELMGAGLFVSSLVVSAVIFMSPIEVMPPRRPFVRDVLFFLGAVALIMTVLYDHEVSLEESLLLIGYYICYVIVVLVGRCIFQARKKDRPMMNVSPLNCSEETITIMGGEPDADPSSPLIQPDVADTAMTYLPKVGILEEKGRITLDKRHAKFIKRVSSRQLQRIYHYKRNLKEYFDWEKMDTKDIIIFIALLPLTLLRHATIPWMAEGKYLRLFCLLYPLNISIFCLAAMQGWDIYVGRCPLWVILLVVGVVLAAVLFEITEKKPRKPPRFYSLLCIPSMIMSVIWIYIAATELVAVLEAVGEILGISSAIMGLTVLAWGNSVADMISNSIISKKSFPQMALGACYAAPLCNMLLGLGISWTFYVIKTGNSFALETPDELPNTVFFAVIILMANLTFTLIFVILSKFKLTKLLGVILLVIYVAFTTVGILSETGVLLGDTPLFWTATS